MIYTIVIPFIVHLPFRRIHRMRKIIIQNSPLITALGLIIVFIAATSKNRSIILENPVKVLLYTLISVISYLVLYLIGYYFDVPPG